MDKDSKKRVNTSEESSSISLDMDSGTPDDRRPIVGSRGTRYGSMEDTGHARTTRTPPQETRINIDNVVPKEGASELGKGYIGDDEYLILEDCGKLHFVVAGKSGTGKSSLCSQLAGREDVFAVGSGLSSVTTSCQQACVSRFDKRFTILDTPGEASDKRKTPFSLNTLVERLKKHSYKTGCRVVICVCVRCDSRYAAEEHRTYLELKSIWGDDKDFCGRLVVTFTRGDNLTLEDSFEQTQEHGVSPASTEIKRVVAEDGTPTIETKRERREERRHADERETRPKSYDKGEMGVAQFPQNEDIGTFSTVVQIEKETSDNSETDSGVPGENAKRMKVEIVESQRSDSSSLPKGRAVQALVIPPGKGTPMSEGDARETSLPVERAVKAEITPLGKGTRSPPTQDDLFDNKASHVERPQQSEEVIAKSDARETVQSTPVMENQTVQMTPMTEDDDGDTVQTTPMDENDAGESVQLKPVPENETVQTKPVTGNETVQSTPGTEIETVQSTPKRENRTVQTTPMRENETVQIPIAEGELEGDARETSAERALKKKLKATWPQLQALVKDAGDKFVLFNSEQGHMDERAVRILMDIVDEMKVGPVRPVVKNVPSSTKDSVIDVVLLVVILILIVGIILCLIDIFAPELL